MTTRPQSRRRPNPTHAGLRLSAEQFFALPDDGNRYELVDGITFMSPSPTPRHQRILMEIAFQLETYLRGNPVGLIFPETDVQLGAARVYRPELVFLPADRVAANLARIVDVPALVVEIVSPATRAIDTQTKKDDYEAAGIHEYWLIDPDDETLSFFRLHGGRYKLVSVEGQSFRSEAVPGFTLDLEPIRRAFTY